jgi:hypothetical protein
MPETDKARETAWRPVQSAGLQQRVVGGGAVAHVEARHIPSHDGSDEEADGSDEEGLGWTGVARRDWTTGPSGISLCRLLPC